MALLVPVHRGILKEIWLPSNSEFSIGRYRSNNLVITDEDVHGTHCILEEIDQQWTLTNLSDGDIYINGCRLIRNGRSVLICGDRFTIAKSTLKYTFRIPTVIDEIIDVVSDSESEDCFIVNPPSRTFVEEYLYYHQQKMRNTQEPVLIEDSSDGSSEDPSKVLPRLLADGDLGDVSNSEVEEATKIPSAKLRKSRAKRLKEERAERLTSMVKEEPQGLKRKLPMEDSNAKAKLQRVQSSPP